MSAIEDSARTIFLAALERAPDQWPEFLDQGCGENSELRARVDELLIAHKALGTIDGRGAPALDAIAEENSITEGAGAVIGPYKLLQQIGEGGMGVVFMAEQMAPVRRKLALKIIKPGMDTRQVIARFEAERQALALMDHPNIARVFDAGTTTSGRPYFVMELVHGVPITEYCDRQKLSSPERLRLFVDVCRAVQHAHQKGVIHRDLKPSNVMVTMRDDTAVPKVIDFGVSKAIGQQLTEKTLFTSYGQMVGTPMYMSPEQAQLSELDVDTRSDVYSLGVLLYELMTGTTPFDEATLKRAGFDEMRRMIREDEPACPSARINTLKGDVLSTVADQRRIAPRQLSQSLRGEVDWIVMKCLEKDRTRRYQSANSLAADIERFLNDEPVQACPPSAAYRFRKFARRNQIAMAAGTVVGVAVCVTALVASLSAVSLREQQRTTVRHLREVQQSERNAQLRLVDAKLAQARAGGHSREPGQRLAAWQAIAEAAGLAGQLQVNDSLAQELRNEAIALLSQPDVRLESQWEGWPKGSLGLAFDADLKRYAYSDEQGNITICSAPDGRQLATLSADGVSAAAPQLRFSPDGRYLLARHHRRPNQSCNFRLWDWQNGKIGLEHGEQIESFVGDFSPDGQRFVVATPDGMLTFYETATVNVLQRIELGTAPRSIAFDSKGEKLGLIGAGSGKVQVLALPSGEVLHTFSPDSFALNVAWHSSGALLAVGCNNGTIEIWDATTGERHGMLHGHRATAAFIEFMPDGDTLLSYAWDGTSRLWDVWACREVVQFEGEAIRFSKNGLRLASRAGNRVQLWELRPSTVYRPLPSRPTFHPNVDVTADGRWLVQATENRFRVWDLENNQAVANVPLQGATAVLFHPTRSELYTSSYSGLYRWPWQIQDDCLHIGPPGKLPIGGLVSDITFDGDGHTLAVAMNGSEGGATVLDLRAETNEPQHFGHPWAIWIAMSPDGRFVASGPHHGLGVKVWQIDNGKLVRELVTKDRPVTVTFSPDGRWLVTGTVGELLVWEVGSWQFAQRIPRQPADGCGFAAFSNDGEILAVTESTSIVQLLATRDWRTLARLTPPDRNAVIPHFTPDSTQLIVAGGGVHVWDLRNLRDQLAGIGLDWDATPYPAKADTPAPQPMRVEVDIGELADATASQ